MTAWTVARQAPLSMDYLQARILEWVAIPFSRGSSQSRDRTHQQVLMKKKKKVLVKYKTKKKKKKKNQSSLSFLKNAQSILTYTTSHAYSLKGYFCLLLYSLTILNKHSCHTFITSIAKWLSSNSGRTVVPWW